jgi:predicted RNA binding protein YcfA (HicA-like mRNA interferase family)
VNSEGRELRPGLDQAFIGRACTASIHYRVAVTSFGAMKWTEIRDILVRDGYKVVRQKGSHISLRAEGRTPITMSLQGKEAPPGIVRKVLVKDAQMTEERIKDLR